MKPTKQSKTKSISDAALIFLYDEVLLYYENDEIDFSGYNLKNNPFLKKLETDQGFSLENNMKKLSMDKKKKLSMDKKDVFLLYRFG